ncbi:Immunoglobulin-like domain [Trinorchestia longiramus]|nr:Immunoglobulin-like domain [Trinorchestia longiramus]
MTGATSTSKRYELTASASAPDRPRNLVGRKASTVNVEVGGMSKYDDLRNSFFRNTAQERAKNAVHKVHHNGGRIKFDISGRSSSSLGALRSLNQARSLHSGRSLPGAITEMIHTIDMDLDDRHHTNKLCAVHSQAPMLGLEGCCVYQTATQDAVSHTPYRQLNSQRDPSTRAFMLQRIQALKLREVSVPGYSRTGDTVTLHCDFDLEGDQLYNVKWYKGVKEFFRYVAADSPPKQVFDLPGVTVDRDRSSMDKVVLSSVTPQSSGNYKCEVSAEAPSFHTDSGSGKLLVVDLPSSPPRLSGVKRQYHAGDSVNLNCSSKSKPAAALSWYINDVKAEQAYLVDYAPVRGRFGLEMSTLGLQFYVRPEHMQHGVLSFRCTATIASVYYKESKIDVRALLSPNPSSLNGREKLTGASAGGGVPSQSLGSGGDLWWWWWWCRRLSLLSLLQVANLVNLR